VLVPFDDGHSPGSTSVRTQMALYKEKHSEKFFSVFDDLLPLEWCQRGYDYAVGRGKPWGKERHLVLRPSVVAPQLTRNSPPVPPP
jgi:hypothetical protein